MAVFIIARLTFLEAVRRRILAAASILGVLFLAVYGAGFYFMLRENNPAYSSPALTLAFKNALSGFMTIAGLYAVCFLCVAMAALLTADTLAGEIGSGTIQSLVAKPLRRSQIVLGKWLGYALLLALYLLLLGGGVIAIAYALAGYTVPQAATGLALMYLEALLVMSVAMALSSSLSTLATGGVVFGMYGLAFIGGWVEQFGAMIPNQTAVNVGVVSSLLMPTEALWHSASYAMTPSLTQVFGQSMGGPFVVLSVPSQLMIVYAVVYLVVAVVIAIRRFGSRDL